MPLIPLIILGLVFLVGVVALAIGHKGWSWGSVAAAWLVLLTALGACFLVAMLGQREREWRNVVGAYISAIARERDALVPAGGTKLRPDGASKSIATLEDERERWERVRDRIDTWRGRHWEDAEFVPPTEGRPGTVTIAGLENSTIHPGAELYVFDATPIEEGGRFLGAYRVDAVDKNVFSVSNVSVPDAADRAALAQPRSGKVVVYEDLPIDRWTAFHRTPVPDQPGTAGEGSVDGAGPGGETAAAEGGIPVAAKSSPEMILRNLERTLEEIRLHDTVIGGVAASPTAADGVPAENSSIEGATPGTEGDGGTPPGVSRPVTDPTLSETPPLGVRWARVVFAKPFTYVWPDGSRSSFVAGDALPSIPADQVARLRAEGADFTSTWSIPPGLYWANVEFKQDHSFQRPRGGEALEFATGRTALFDLDTAKSLEQQGIVSIVSVIFRRPLSDGNVALRGAGTFQAEGSDIKLDVNGLVVMRRILEEDKRSIDASIGQLKTAVASTREEIARREREEAELEADKVHWKDDVAAANRAVQAFSSRLESIRTALSSTEVAIAELGREFNASVAGLTQAIDQSAPAPSQPPPAAVGR